MTTITTSIAGAKVRSRRDHAVVITCDSHSGPLLKEHMRQYCPAKYLQQFDEFAEQATSLSAAMQQARRQQAGSRSEGTGGAVAGTGGASGDWDNTRTEGGWDMAARMRDMNYDGIAAEI